MKKIIQSGFLVEVFGLEAEIAFGGAGLGDEVAEGVVVSGGDSGLSLVGVYFVDSAHLVLDVGIPAVRVGEEVGRSFGEFYVSFYGVFSDAVSVSADGGKIFIKFHCQVVAFPVEMGGGSIYSFGEAATKGVVGIVGHCGRRCLVWRDVLEASEAIIAGVIEEFLLSGGFIEFFC